MKSYRLIFIAIAAIGLVWAVKAYAGTLQMTTYYPAPTGFYENLKINNGLIIPCRQTAPTNPASSSIWIESSNCPAP